VQVVVDKQIASDAQGNPTDVETTPAIATVTIR
jgi:hypothetical protein